MCSCISFSLLLLEGEVQFLHLALAVLKLTMESKLVSVSQSAGMKGGHRHAWPFLIVWR